MERQRTCICIDLKSFYASVECVERGLDPLTTNLVVADPERSEKTICLAITPSMKALGIKNRCRVFEIPKSVEYIMAPPRMQKYIDYSVRVVSVYLKYVSFDDMYVYSIDEVFMDVTEYLELYQLSAVELSKRIIQEVIDSTGITATAGIGTNLYLAKIAMDITAKHVEDHIGVLDEESFKKTLWDHLPLTDFWRVGPGTVRKLAKYGMFTMRDIAEADEDLLYRIFGIDAELMIDHAYGIEPTTISDIKKYRPRHNSMSSGQVLARDYSFEEGLLVIKEMADLLCLDLVERGVVTQSITLFISYSSYYDLASANGSIKMENFSSSSKYILPYVEKLYKKVADPALNIRKLNISFNDVSDETYIQYDLFTNPEDVIKERKLQRAMIEMKKKYGKNAILKGMNLKEGATAMERNRQIGGHKSGS